MASKKSRSTSRTLVRSDVITVNSGEIAAVARWASEDASRLPLTGVFFGDDHYVATDGKRMVIVPCRTHGLKLLIHRSVIIAACQAQSLLYHPDEPDTIDISPSGDAQVTLGLLPRVSMRASLLRAEFPDWKEAVSSLERSRGKWSENKHRTFDARYLAAIHEVNEQSARYRNDPAAKPGIPEPPAVQITSLGGERDSLHLVNAYGIRFIVMPIVGRL